MSRLSRNEECCPRIVEHAPYNPPHCLGGAQMQSPGRWFVDRAARHRVENGKPATLTKEQLADWESFAAMIERGSS